MGSQPITVASCGRVAFTGDGPTVREIVEACALDAGFEACDFTEYDNPIDLVDAIAHCAGKLPIDLVIIGSDIAGMSGIELLREVFREDCGQYLVLCSADYSDAIEALECEVDKYLIVPMSHDSFRAALVKLFARVKGWHEDSVVICFREGVRRVRASQVMYVETSGHDQIVHLADGTDYSVRMSSGDLFDILEGSGKFFKAGSSYIVNMRNVRSVNARQSMAQMTNGQAIPIPGRVRKSLENAILANE